VGNVLIAGYFMVNSLEVSWREKEPGSLFVNLSLLPYADAEKLL
jgi:hypothetical protein